MVRPNRRGAPTDVKAPMHVLFDANDGVVSALLLHLLPIVLRNPPEAWPAKAREVSRDLHRYFRRELFPFTSRIPRRLTELAAMEPEALSLELFAAYVLEKMEVLACGFGRYDPTNLRLDGRGHLERALEAGKGAVLWCESSFSSSLLQKAAVASAGYRVHHLSRRGHNLSSTRFGMRFLNPIVRRGENRYLEEVILVDGANQLAVSRHIMEVLAGNGIVSVTVIPSGAQTLEAPLLDGTLSVATGAPHFALRGGAALLPVLSHRAGAHYVAQIGEPIELTGMAREAAYDHAAHELARRIESYIAAHPLDWSGWLRGPYTEATAS
jgi:predicted LPLAT superfamily acyltransferase